MLGKLLKYDCRCTARSFIPIGLIYLIVSVFMRILTQFEDAFSGNLIGNLFFILIVIAYSLLTYFLPLMAVFGNMQRFSKNFFTDEGYLMLTLPVKPWQHIVSKLISAVIWYIISIIALVISVVVLVGNTNIMQQLLSTLELIGIGVKEIIQEYPFHVFMAFVVSLTAFTWLMLMGYFSTCVSKMLVKSKKSVAEVLVVIGIVFLNVTVLSYLAQWLSMNLGVTFMEHSPISDQILFGCTFFAVIFAVFSVLYFIFTCYVLKNKVNLE